MRPVLSNENLGFGGGNNRAAEAAAGEYLFLLNNSTAVQDGWLEPLLRLATSAPEIGAVGAKLIYPDGRLQEAGGLVFSDGSAWSFGRFADPDAPEYCYVREVDYCSAAALLVRADLFRQVGGFDRLYHPAYYEDVDLCFALRRLGYRVLVQPHARVTHYEGVTGGTSTQSGAKRHQQTNGQAFARKWADELAEQATAAALRPERGLARLRPAHARARQRADGDGRAAAAGPAALAAGGGHAARLRGERPPRGALAYHAAAGEPEPPSGQELREAAVMLAPLPPRRPRRRCCAACSSGAPITRRCCSDQPQRPLGLRPAAQCRPARAPW